MRSFRRSIKAVSPVIATIIIVAIAITMSIAVAYWLLGLGGSFTKYEKIEFSAAYVTRDATNSDFIIHMDLKNTGSAAATIDPAYILYNGKPATAYPAADQPVTTGFNTLVTPATATPMTLDPGKAATNSQIVLADGGTWVSGMTVEVMLHTAGGKDYPKVLTLP